MRGHYPGYRYMVQCGFELDPRSEPPQEVFDGAMRDIAVIKDHSIVLSASHQPNLEIVAAGLSGNLGTNGNELFDNAGGPFGMGGGIQLVFEYKGDKVDDAILKRTYDNPCIMHNEPLPLDMDVLKKYIK